MASNFDIAQYRQELIEAYSYKPKERDARDRTRDQRELSAAHTVQRLLDHYADACIMGKYELKSEIASCLTRDFVQFDEMAEELKKRTTEVGQVKALREFSENVANAAYAYLTAEDHSDPEPLVRLGEAVELWLHHKDQSGDST